MGRIMTFNEWLEEEYADVGGWWEYSEVAMYELAWDSDDIYMMMEKAYQKGYTDAMSESRDYEI